MEYPVAYRRQALKRAGLSNARLVRVDTMRFAAANGQAQIDIPVLVPANDNRKPGKVYLFPRRPQKPPPQGPGAALRKRLKRFGMGLLQGAGPRLLHQAAEQLDAAVGQRVNPTRVNPGENVGCEPNNGGWFKGGYSCAHLNAFGAAGPQAWEEGDPLLSQMRFVEKGAFNLYYWEKGAEYAVTGNADQGPAVWPAAMPYPAIRPRIYPETNPERLPNRNPAPNPRNWPLRLPRPLTPYLPFQREAANGLLQETKPNVVPTLVQQMAPTVLPPRVTGGTPPKKPEKYIKESKMKLSTRGSTLGIVLNVATESGDLIEALWWALPKWARTPHASGYEMLLDLWYGLEYINWTKALKNVAFETLTDYIYGSVGNALAGATAGNPYWVSITGPQAGPVDQPPRVVGVGTPDWLPSWWDEVF